MVGYNIRISAEDPAEVAKDAFRIYARFCHFMTLSDLDDLAAEFTKTVMDDMPNLPVDQGEREPEPPVVEEKTVEAAANPEPEPEPEIDLKTLKKALIAVRSKAGMEKVDQLYANYAHNAASVGKVAKEDYGALYAACQEVLNATD